MKVDSRMESHAVRQKKLDLKKNAIPSYVTRNAVSFRYSVR
jgi:hypothetical protein